MGISGPRAVSKSEFSWLEVETVFLIIWWLGADLAVHGGTPRNQEDEIDPFNIVQGLKWTFLKSRDEIEP